jgi:hypothetical protein
MIDLMLLLALIISGSATIYLLDLAFLPIREFLSDALSHLLSGIQKVLTLRSLIYLLVFLGVSGIIILIASSLAPIETETGATLAASAVGLYKILEWLWEKIFKPTSKAAKQELPQKTIDEQASGEQILREGFRTKDEIKRMLSPVYYPDSFNRISGYIVGTLRAKVPLVLYEDDSKTLEVIYGTEADERGWIELCKLVMTNSGELRIHLMAVAFDVAGKEHQTYSGARSVDGFLTSFAPVSFTWILSPKRSGKQEINLVVTIRNSAIMTKNFPFRIRVNKLFGLTARQIRIFTILFSIITGLVAIANATHTLGLW